MILVNIFNEVKALVDNKNLASYYLGSPVKKSGLYYFYRSPFRSERTASFAVTQKSFVDFGSGWKGDCIKFVAELFSLKPLQAANKINQDFSLGITCNSACSPSSQKVSDYTIIKGLKIWRDRTLDKLTNTYKLCKKLNKDPQLSIELAEIEADLDIMTDALIFGTETEWYEIYKKLGKLGLYVQ